MMRLCEVMGFTYNDIVDITGYLLTILPFCVFIGILMYDAFIDISASIGRVLRYILRHIKTPFRTFGK